MINNQTFSIIFPVMNQGDHIEKVIKSYHDALSKNHFNFEIIAVVNGTKDRSYKITSKLALQLSNTYIYNLKDSGYGLGILFGLNKAKGEYLCYLNCARVHAHELITSLQAFLKKPEAITHAVRIRRDVFYRKLSSIVYNFVCKLLFKINSSDINGSPKIFSQENYQKMHLTFKNSMIDLELIDKAQKNHIKIVEIPIYKNERHGGKSTSSFKTIFRLIKEVINYWFITRIKVNTNEKIN